MALVNDSLVREISEFIARLNRSDESHVAYCGSDPLEIASALSDFENPLEDCLVIQRDGSGEIDSLIGVDIENDSGYAEVWGPFIDSSDWEAACLSLWTELIAKTSSQVTTYSFFLNERNTRTWAFFSQRGGKPSQPHLILDLRRQNYQPGSSVLRELDDGNRVLFEKLHDKVFPNTYLTGQQILEKLGVLHKVFVSTLESQLAGYVYVEAQPEFSESTIHFFAVDEKYRGRGIAQALLRQAIEFIFGFDTISSITLCVEDENARAIAIYKKVGFVQKHRCRGLKISFSKI